MPPEDENAESEAQHWDEVIEDGRYAAYLDWQDEEYIAYVGNEEERKCM